MGCGQSKVSARKVGVDFQSNLINEHSLEEKCFDTYKMAASGVLGAGAYGTVFCAHHKDTDREVAIKSIKVGNGETWENLINEVNIMKKLRHPNIVRLYETFRTATSLQLIMHKCSGGDLRKFVKTQYPRGGIITPAYEQRIARMATKVLAAVAYMHHRQVCHRDLKLENIMLETTKDDAEVVVMDFGLGEVLNAGEKLNDSTGTLPYMAPEMINEDVPYAYPCDVWAVGVCVYELIANKLPFHNGPHGMESLDSVQQKLMDPQGTIFSEPVWSGVSDEGKACILKLLEFDGQKRPTAEEAQLCSWITTHHDPNEQFNHFKDTKAKTAKLVSDLRQFSDFGDLKQAALMSAAFELDESKIEELKKEFNMIDTHNNGRITRDELQKLMELDHDHVMKESEVKAVFDSIDQDGDGTINWLEFLGAATHASNLLHQQHWNEAFKLLDIDHTGKISMDNVEQIFGRAADAGKAKKIIADFDTDGDGVVSLKEFMAMVEQLQGHE